MAKTNVFIVFFLFCSFTLFSQYSIQSHVYDETNGGSIEVASVRLYKLPDSTFIQAIQTDSKGHFSLTRVNPGSYYLNVSFLGYHDFSTNVDVKDKNITLKNIQLAENVQQLSEVIVRGTAAQMVVRGDTIEFNANAFKLGENSVVEDLLKRLPGVEITTEGKITVNGQEITKIRVDGKKFFEGDAEMATKNIPAELIEKVQVIEEKSEMAKLTGFEDDDTERIINLTFKESRKRGQFGNVSLGAGADIEGNFRYDTNAFLNLINGESQTAITGGANNVNTTRSSRGRGDFNTNNGITESQNLGINNSAILNPTLSIGGDATYNHSANDTQTESNRESYLSNSIYNDYSRTESLTDYHSVNGRVELEWKPDTLTTMLFQPNFSYNRTFSDRNNSFSYLEDGDTTSHGKTRNNSLSSGVEGRMRFTYSRKSANKYGRSLTVRLDGSFSENDSESFNYSEKLGINSDIIDQKTLDRSNRYGVNVRLSYVEPLWNNQNLLEVVAALETNRRNSEKQQYYGEDYSIYDNNYSNTFENTFYQETMELNYRYFKQNYNLTLGIKAEPSQTQSTTIYGNDSTAAPINNNVFNFAPSARFQYNFAKRKFIRVFYRGRSSQPSITQMQPVKNNSDLMNETVGNPYLNPAFSHNLFSTFSSFNEKRFSSLTIDFRASATKDALVSNRIYDASGKQYNQTINATELPYNLSSGIMYNTPLVQKRLHFNTNTRFSFDKRYGYSSRGVAIDSMGVLPLGDLSMTDNYGLQQQLSLTFTHDIVEVGVRGNMRYSNTHNNLSTTSTSETTDWTGTGNLVFHLPSSFTLSSDLSYTTRQGYTGFNQSELIWNASIDKTLFKNKAVLSLRANDILQQQLNIRQTIGDNYIQYNSYNTLQSYFLISFSYKLNRFSGMSASDAQSQGNRRQEERRGPPQF